MPFGVKQHDSEPIRTAAAISGTGGTPLALHRPFELARGYLRMDRPALTRMQIRVVLTVFRSEMARLNRVDPVGAGFDAGRLLRLRSIELLDQARARLNGDGINQPELLGELQSAREEVAGEAPVGAVPDRHGGTVDPVNLAVARPAVKPEVGGRQPRRP